MREATAMNADQNTGGIDAESTHEGSGGHPRPVMPLVLVVEDDARMRKYLRSTLADQRFRVVDAETGAQALVQAAGHNPDLVVLDFALPDCNAVHVTTKLREWTPAPILILSAHDEEHDKIAALDAGANDFLTKPFGTGELLARIRVWLRHMQRADADSLESFLEVGLLRIDFARRVASVGGRNVRLTPTQYKLFGVMMRNAGKVLTHEQILFMVWGPAYTKETQYLRVYMGKLRQKFEQDAARPKYFITEPGVGYRLRAED
ncbi:MAG TPA: response regulator [Polyangiaceae bacterium]|nr:response regulator [Polyangiaceae bacterium]